MPEDHLVTPLDPKTLETDTTSNKSSFPTTILLILAILLGGLTGYFLNLKQVGSGNVSPETGVEMINSENEFGSTDTQNYRDSATGVLQEGGQNGEGTHKLIRDGGPSQTVYLVSSVMDLSEFVGLKVEVWGETNKGRNVGWLMDVGRVKKLE